MAGDGAVRSAVRAVIGDYAGFVTGLFRELDEAGLRPPRRPLSHLGYKAPSWDDHTRVRAGLLEVARAYVENDHNGRPIAKIMLSEDLPLPDGWAVPMVEVMPPKGSGSAVTGLEHGGFVIGDGLEGFIAEHRSVLSGRQDQGPFCRPAYVRFASGRRAKFYQYSLADVVRLEGHEFVQRRPER